MAVGTGLSVASCASGETRRALFAPPAPLRPLNLTPDRLMRITVCTRPFRSAGPRLGAVRLGQKTLIHNYGHGGAGWSIAWGCAADTTELAMAAAPSPARIAVIGAGVIGMTTAIRLAETGADVTIYAEDFPAETRSARATGTWSPSSRIALTDNVDDTFADRWERWARISYGVHQRYIGKPGAPVEYLPHYALYDDPRGPRSPATRDFLHLGRAVRALSPAWRTLDAGDFPFNAARARSGLRMIFNVAAYSDLLTRGFLLRGGRMERRSFPDVAAVTALDQPIIVNCAGYGAKSLWGDDDLFPVRGQINWLAPQSDARYGIYYRNTSALSRSDGVIVQYTGPNEDWGFGDDTEKPDRSELTTALDNLAPLFA